MCPNHFVINCHWMFVNSSLWRQMREYLPMAGTEQCGGTECCAPHSQRSHHTGPQSSVDWPGARVTPGLRVSIRAMVMTTNTVTSSAIIWVITSVNRGNLDAGSETLKVRISNALITNLETVGNWSLDGRFVMTPWWHDKFRQWEFNTKCSDSTSSSYLS